MNKQQLPSSWQLGDKVQVVFPGNGILRNCTIIKVSFKEHGDTLYDVEVPYDYMPGDSYEGEPEFGYKGKFRLHSVPQWFLSYNQEEWDYENSNSR